MRQKEKTHFFFESQTGGVILKLAELHGDVFSRHASPLEVYVFVAVDERGEDRYVRRD